MNTYLKLSSIAVLSLSTTIGWAMTPTAQSNVNSDTTQLSSLPAAHAKPAHKKKKSQCSKYQNNATVVQLKPDQYTFTVELPANATTGYQWYLSRYDEQKLQLSNYEYKPDQTHLVGAPGKAIFTFHALPNFHAIAPQVTRLGFYYMQPWNMRNATKKMVLVVSPGKGKDDAMTHTANQTLTADSPHSMAPTPDQTLNDSAHHLGSGAPIVEPSQQTTTDHDNWLSLPDQSDNDKK